MARHSDASGRPAGGSLLASTPTPYAGEDNRWLDATGLETAGHAHMEESQQAGDGGLGVRPAAVRLRSRRNPRLIALGVLLACLGGLSGGLLWQQQSHSRSVLVMTHNVPKGQVVQSGDVASTSIGMAPGVAVVPSTELSAVVGKSALVDLGSGTLLAPGSIGQVAAPLADEHVGLKLEVGRVPAMGMTPGTQIQLIPVPGSASDASPVGDPMDAVMLTSPQAGATGEVLVFDVAVSPADAVRVVQLAARNQLAVVRKAGQ